MACYDRWFALLVARWLAAMVLLVCHVATAQTGETRFVVEGNTLLPQATVDASLPPLTSAPDLAAINAAVERLREAYRAAGYGAVVVNLPEQTITAGTVRLEVVEGRLGRVYLQGQKHYSEANILRGLPTLKLGQPPNLVAIDANTYQTNESAAKASRVTLQPGTQSGEVDALVVTADRSPQRYSAAVDNTGSDATGRYRAALMFQHANMFDRDHQFGVRAEFTPSDAARSNAASFSYSVPFYAQLSAVEVVASYSDVESKKVATIAGDAEFAGEGTAVGVRYRRYLPRIGLLRQRASIGFDYRNYRNDCSVGVLGEAGCGSAAVDIDARPLNIGYDARLGEAHTMNLLFVANAFPGGADGDKAAFAAARSGARARYRLLRGNVGSRFVFKGGVALGLRGAFQYSPDALVASEQAGAGGADTVRGYEERELTGDRSVLGSAELTVPLIADALLSSQFGALRLAFFADASRVSNVHDTPCDEQGSACSIASTGLGLRWSFREQLFARADVARALRDAPQTDKGETMLHFVVGYAR